MAREGVAPAEPLRPHLYPHFGTEFVLELNEMVLSFGRITSTKNPKELECDMQRCG